MQVSWYKDSVYKALKSTIETLNTNLQVSLAARQIAIDPKTTDETKKRKLKSYLELGPEVTITIINRGGKRGFRIEGKEKIASVEMSQSYETTVS